MEPDRGRCLARYVTNCSDRAFAHFASGSVTKSESRTVVPLRRRPVLRERAHLEHKVLAYVSKKLLRAVGTLVACVYSQNPKLSLENFMRTMLFLIPVFAVWLCPAAYAGAVIGSSKSVFSKVSSPGGSELQPAGRRLARVTAYWPGEDYYTTRKLSATGARLKPGCCAVDSRIIPYGSVVRIPGLGNYVAMDTGTAVISRKAAKESGQNWKERGALVIDLYFPSRRSGEEFSREGPKFAMVAWNSGSESNRE